MTSLLDPKMTSMLLRTLVREERARADRLAEVARTDGLIPTPWAVLRQVADRIAEIANALDDSGGDAGRGEGADPQP